MKTKHLLLTLLMAFMVPLAVNAQSSLPFSENFNSVPVNQLPTDWVLSSTQVGTVTAVVQKETPTSTNRILVMGVTKLQNGNGALAVQIPTNEIGKKLVKMTFKLMPTSANSGTFRVVCTTTSFTGAMNIAEFNASDLTVGSWNYITVPVTLSSTRTITFSVVTNTANTGWAIDDVSVTDGYIPANVTSSNITDTSVEVSWDAQSGITEWQVLYSASWDWDDPVTFTTTTNSCTITGLDENSLYYVKVAAKKGSYLSSYSERYGFTTLQRMDRDHPITENFEQTYNWNNWIFRNTDTSPRWIRGTETYHPHFFGETSAYSIYVAPNSGTTNSYTTSYSGRTNCIYAYKQFYFAEPNADYEVSYYWKGVGEDQKDYLRVALVPNTVDISNLTCLAPPDGLSYNTLPEGWMALDGGTQLNQTWQWTLQEESLHVSTPGIYTVVFVWVNDTYVINDPPAAVDDFSMEYVLCTPSELFAYAPEGLTSIYCYWEDVTNALSYTIQYKMSTETEWTTVEGITNSHYLLSNLEEATEYQVRMTCDCASSYSNVVTVTTHCEPLNIPIVYDFADGLPPCLEYSGNEFSTSFENGGRVFVFSGAPGNYYASFQPISNLSTLTYGPYVGFRWRHDSSSPDSNDGVQVQYSTDNVTWNNVGDFIPRYSETAGWTEKKIAVTALAGLSGNGYIRLCFTGAGVGSCALDDLTLGVIGNCSTIDSITKVLNGDEATLSWTAGDFQNEWQIYHSTNGSTYMGSVSADDIITVTEPTVTLEGLPWGTYVWIRANCIVSGSGYSSWTRFDLTEDVEPCESVTGLTYSETYNHDDITVSWTPADHQTEWQVVYSNDSSFNIDDVTEGQIHVATEPSYTMHLWYEYTYRVWVRGNCMLEGGYSDWEMISFMPTQYAGTTLNDGTATNTMVPVNTTLTNTENLSMSQFIIPQASLASYEGKIKGLKFYTDAATAADFTDAKFNVYMRETNQTAFSADEFADWTAMIPVYYGGSLSIEQEGESFVMNVNFPYSYYFDYSGQGNLMVGIQQTVQGTDATAPTCAWYGVETTDYAAIGMNNSAEITRCQFLPKMQIINRVVDVPCPKPTSLTATNIHHNSIVLSWVAGLEETEWMLSYRESSGGDWTDVAVTENPYTLTGLNNNTGYQISLKASCGGDEYSNAITVFVTTALGNQFITDGNWNEAANWSFNEVPSAGEVVYIAATAVVPNGCIAEVNTINMLSGGSLTIADGGQMKCDNPFSGVIEKDIVGYGAENIDDNTGYYLIATPIQVSAVQGNIVPVEETDYLFDEMDLYWFNENNEGEEWFNPKNLDGIIDGHVALSPKNGYLYARQNDGTLSFGTGYTAFPATNEDISVSLRYYSSSTAPFNGWNLIGNPFTCDAYLVDENGDIMPFYRMNDSGDAIVGGQPGTAIKPCEGVFVFCPNDGESHYAVFTTTAPATVGTAQNYLSVALPLHNLRGNQDASVSTVTQTIALVAGTNWVSFNVETTMDDLRAALVAALPGTEITIKSQTQSCTYKNNRWTGSLKELDDARMYLIKATAAVQITLSGRRIDPTEQSVTIVNGINWIAYPFDTNMSVVNAFAGFAVDNDLIKAQATSATYKSNRWTGQLKTLEPGRGYIYKSAATNNRVFTYPTMGK